MRSKSASPCAVVIRREPKTDRTMETTVKIKKTSNGWMVDEKEYGSLNAVIDEISKRFRFGDWQRGILYELLSEGKVHASVEWYLSNTRWSKYGGRYQRSLYRVVEAVGAKFIPGKRGGKCTGYYVLDLEEENA